MNFRGALRIGAQLALGVVVAPGALSQVPLSGDPARVSTNLYEFRPLHDRDGIGKFYMGREIAAVMGHQAADWLERPEREQQEHSNQLLVELQIRPGQVVADIGAGTGYFSRRLARQVGPEGKVLAVDLQPEMLFILTNNAARLGLTNVTAIQGTPMDPHLASGSVDLILLVDVYHEFDFPWEMMRHICAALRPSGRVVFVEYRAEDPGVPIKPLHKMTEAQVRKEMAAQPLDWVETRRSLPWQHVIVFKNRSLPAN
jgi:ubiquinone/menaquinone biosynthesis C-methylase UbiE